MEGRFIQQVGNFEEYESYKVFSALKVDSIYRWSTATWSGHADDVIFYIDILDGYTLRIGCALTEYEVPKMLCVGTWQKYRSKLDLKSEIRKIFFDSKSSASTFPRIETREICNYMKWDIDGDYITDWLS